MLHTLKLENFKAWEEVEISFGKITVFFGRNSSGKTSLLQALLLLKQSAEHDDPASVLLFKGKNALVDLDSFHNVIHEGDVNKNLVFELGWDGVAGKRYELKNEMTYSTEKLLSIKKLHRKEVTVSKSMNKYERCFEFISGEKSKSTFLIKDNARELNEDVSDIFQGSEPLNFYRTNISELSAKSNVDVQDIINFLFSCSLSLDNLLIRSTHYIGPIRENPKRLYELEGTKVSKLGVRGERFMEALHSSEIETGIDLQQKIAESLQRLGLLESFRIEELLDGRLLRVLVKRFKNGPEVPLTDVGFGVSQVLPILVLCYTVEEGSIIVLEQPEIHLHPAAQSALAGELVRFAAERNLQFIIESHSEAFLRRFRLLLATEEFENNFTPEDLKLYFCEQDEFGKGQLDLLELDEYGQVKNWPEDFFGDEYSEIVATQEAITKRKKEKRAKERN